jgi:hypothetical protein
VERNISICEKYTKDIATYKGGDNKADNFIELCYLHSRLCTTSVQPTHMGGSYKLLLCFFILREGCALVVHNLLCNKHFSILYTTYKSKYTPNMKLIS